MPQDRSPMHTSSTRWALGIPHTICRALGETALLAQTAHYHWTTLAQLVGCPASRLVDAAGREVYASVYLAEIVAPPARGLASFGPDDELAVEGTLGRFGPSLLDGAHTLRPVGADGPTLAVRLSFVLVGRGAGADDLQVSTPSNARIDQVPPLGREPQAYRQVKALRSTGFEPPPPTARRLWPEAYSATYPINPDRDLNGVGLLYFANYVAFLDAAERAALVSLAGLAPAQLDGRVTVRRRIAYYGNARPSDALQVGVEAFGLDAEGRRLLVQQRVCRVSDGRLIALASAERLLIAAS
ncbi:MAG: LnmK family bifunctional acyltransferase/decarboxylase [Candidatus Binatia bacterium]